MWMKTQWGHSYKCVDSIGRHGDIIAAAADGLAGGIEEIENIRG